MTSKEGHNQPAELVRRVAIRTAWIAGVFSLIVCVTLAAGTMRARWKTSRTETRLTELKKQLVADPKNDELRERIRLLDLEYRRVYFRHLAFVHRGRWVLLFALVVFVIAEKTAVSAKRAIPRPQGSMSEEDVDSGRAPARRAVATAGFVLAVAAILLAWGFAPKAPIEKTAVFEKNRATPGEAEGPRTKPFPSDEEIVKNWPQFRGPYGWGVAHYTNQLEKWNGKTGEGILWKTEIPLPGQNSPVVWGDRIFLSGATEKRREVYCVDANTGKILWTRSVSVPGTDPEPPQVMEDTGYAAPSMATDGRYACAIFANGDLACFDHGGKILWAKNLGKPDNMYGHASSLMIYQNLLIVQYDQGDGEDGKAALLAFDLATGRKAWAAKRMVPNSWSSPILIKTPDGDQVVTSANPWVIAYEPLTGKEIWRVECLSGDVGPSPAFADGLVFVCSQGAALAAIRPGKGNVTKTNLVWTNENGLADTCSPVSNGKFVFSVDASVLMCFEAKSGKEIWEKEYEDIFRCSPVIVGKLLYITDEKGVTHVLEVGDKPREIAASPLGERSDTTPAFLDGRIYIRGKKHLFCIGEKDR